MSDNIHAVGGGWGGAGPQGKDGITREAMLEQVGGNWKAEERKVFYLGDDGQPVEIKGYKTLLRSDDHSPLAIHANSYGVTQHTSLYDVADDIVGSGEARYTSAGFFGHGKRSFVSLALDGEVRVGKDDVVYPFLNLFDSYDGTVAFTAKGGSLRPICINTYQQALNEQTMGVKLRHTKNVMARVAMVGDILRAAHAQFAKMGEAFQAMQAKQFSDKEMIALAEKLIPGEATKSENSRAKLQYLFANGKGQAEYSDVRGTAWAAFNAVTEFADHFRSTRVVGGVSENNARLNSAWLGSGAQMKDKAFQYLIAA